MSTRIVTMEENTTIAKSRTVQPKERHEKHKIVHDYHDFSHVREEDLDITPKEVQRTEHAFPLRLYDMLSGIEESGLEHIVSWQPHGRCFVVHNHERFVNEVLPEWFSQSKFTSFQRQLSLYGFKRLTKGRDKGAYYHELFLRGKRFLCRRIHRTKVKGTKYRQSSSPETEPNFYLIPFLNSSKTETRSREVVANKSKPNQQKANASLVSNRLPASAALSCMGVGGLPPVQSFGPTAIPSDSLAAQQAAGALLGGGTHPLMAVPLQQGPGMQMPAIPMLASHQPIVLLVLPTPGIPNPLAARFATAAGASPQQLPPPPPPPPPPMKDPTGGGRGAAAAAPYARQGQR